MKFFCNTKHLLETTTKLMYIIHLKAFVCKLDKVLLLKYIVQSQVMTYKLHVARQFAHMCTPSLPIHRKTNGYYLGTSKLRFTLMRIRHPPT